MTCKTKGCNQETPLLFVGYADYCDDCIVHTDGEEDETTKPLFEDWWSDLDVGSSFYYKNARFTVTGFGGSRPIIATDDRKIHVDLDPDLCRDQWDLFTPIPRDEDHAALAVQGTSGSLRSPRKPLTREEFCRAVEQVFAPLISALDDLEKRTHPLLAAVHRSTLDKPTQR